MSVLDDLLAEVFEECGYCGGSGRVFSHMRCPRCGTTGRQPTPAGVEFLDLLQVALDFAPTDHGDHLI